MRRCRIESLGVSLPGRSLLPRGALQHTLIAARRCLKASRHLPGDMGILINCGIHRDDHICEPAIAAFVQHRLGINPEFQARQTLSFDLQNGACGMLSAVEVLSALLQSGESRAGLIVSGEANRDRHPDPAYPYPASGAALALDLSPQAEVGFGPFVFDTRDEHAELFTSVVDLRVPRGRLLLNRAAQLATVYLSMVGAVVDRVLDQEGLSRADIDRVVPAQLSADFLSRLPAVSGFPPQIIADYSADLPDTHSTSLFIALQRSWTASPPRLGEKTLLLAFGSGITVGAVVYRS